MAFIADEHQQGQSLGSDGDGSGSIHIQSEQDTSHGASTTAGGATNQSVILATAGYDHVIKFWTHRLETAIVMSNFQTHK